MNFFKKFHESGHFVRSLNTTFLVLIPKKRGSKGLEGFQINKLGGGVVQMVGQGWPIG